MARWITNLVVSVLSIGAIVAGGRYAVAREQVRNTNLHAVYQQINQEYFSGALTDVPVSWQNLTDEYGETILDGNTAISILIDPQTNKTSGHVVETTKHEMCHVYTGSVGNDHGLVFQDCINRYKVQPDHTGLLFGRFY